MKKPIILIFSILALCLTSCSKYDDSELWNSVNSLENRVSQCDELTISLDVNGTITTQPYSKIQVKYNITGNINNLQVEVLSSGEVRAELSDNNSATGILTITTGPTISEYDKVVVLASNGTTTIMRSLSFDYDQTMKITGETSFVVPASGGTIEFTLETTTQYSIAIPDDAKSWISHTGTRAWRSETVTLKIEPNNSYSRSANIFMLNNSGKIIGSIAISQMSSLYNDIPTDMVGAFPDNEFRKYILSNFDRNADGIISTEEAAKVTQIAFSLSKVTSVEGIRYFPNLVSLVLRECPIETLDVSNNTKLELIQCQNNNLTQLDVSKNVELIRLEVVENNLSYLNLSKNLKLKFLQCFDNPNLSGIDLSTNSNLIYINCIRTGITTLDISKTGLNDSTYPYPLEMGYCNSCKTLYLKRGWEIVGVTKNRNIQYIPETTEIVFVD